MRAGADHFKTEAGDNHLMEEAKPEKPAKREIPDFTKYPREFITYRWYRPIIVAIIFAIVYILLCSILLSAVGVVAGDQYMEILKQVTGGYDSMDVYTVTGCLLTLGSVAIFIPALAIANKIAGRRTFKSYESSRGGGWDFGIFFKCLLIGLIVISLPIVIDYIIENEGETVNRFTRDGLICLIILGPMQCIAEEYAFRSLLMQTIGSWFKVPAVAIILPAIIFAAAHPYNFVGVAEVFISGCIFGLIAWASRGIEASSALHICNNMAVFIMTGLGYGKISEDVEVREVIFSVVIEAVFLAIILIMRKRGRFDKTRGNDAAKYNAKVEKKLAKKKAKKAKKDAKAAKKEIREIEKSGAKHAATPAVEPLEQAEAVQTSEAGYAALEAADADAKAHAADAAPDIIELSDK